MPIKLEIVDVEKVKGLSNYYVSGAREVGVRLVRVCCALSLTGIHHQSAVQGWLQLSHLQTLQSV